VDFSTDLFSLKGEKYKKHHAIDAICILSTPFQGGVDRRSRDGVVGVLIPSPIVGEGKGEDNSVFLCGARTIFKNYTEMHRGIQELH
jgi:hypothetical protein